MNKKLYLPETAQSDFKSFCINKIKKYNIKNILPEVIEDYFNFCIKKETYTTLMHFNTIAGEKTGFGISKIFLPDGNEISRYDDILEYQKNEYNKNNYNFICEALFNDMFCNIEWMIRCKNELNEATRLYKKVFGGC